MTPKKTAQKVATVILGKPIIHPGIATDLQTLRPEVRNLGNWRCKTTQTSSPAVAQDQERLAMDNINKVACVILGHQWAFVYLPKQVTIICGKCAIERYTGRYYPEKLKDTKPLDAAMRDLISSYPGVFK